MNSVQLSEVIIIKSAENTKELILKTSKEIAYTQGLSQVSMRKVASECNIAIGTIYNYYPTKMDIIFEIIEDFWKDCLIGFNQKVYNEMSVFEEIECFYFHIKNYLEQFEQNWFSDLSKLSYDNKSKAKDREVQFRSNLINILKSIIDKHEEKLNDEIFNNYSKDEISMFILNNFMIMLKNNNQSYSIFDYTLKKILT